MATPDMPSLVEMARGAGALHQMDEIRRQNQVRTRLGDILSNPNADIGSPTTLREIMAIDPSTGMELQNRALQTQQLQARTQQSQSAAAQGKLKIMTGLAQGLVSRLDQIPEDQRQAALEQMYPQVIQYLGTTGVFSPEELAQKSRETPDMNALYALAGGGQRKALIPFGQGDKYSFADPYTGQIVQSHPIAPTPTAQLTQGMRGGPEGVAPIPNWGDVKAGHTAQIEGAKETAKLPAYRERANIDVGATYQKELGKGEADIITKERGLVAGKRDALDALDQAQKLLDQGIFTGAYANLQMKGVKAIPGLDKTKAANTEAFRAYIGEVVVPRLKEFGGNDSNEELRYLQGIMGGDISMEEGAIRRILESAELKIRRGIERAERAGAQSGGGGGVVGGASYDFQDPRDGLAAARAAGDQAAIRYFTNWIMTGQRPAAAGDASQAPSSGVGGGGNVEDPLGIR
jgi:hypothetical protein